MNAPMQSLRFVITVLGTVFTTLYVKAQPAIYTDPASLVTGTWAGTGSTIAQTTTGGPSEGVNHYKFSYNFTAWWAGCGLNMDNWTNTPPRNFSGYSQLKLSYKGLNGGELWVSLKSGTVQSTAVFVGYQSANYTTVSIPLSAFTGLNLSSITELVFAIQGIQSSNSTVYVDNITLTNMQAPAYAGHNAMHTNPRTWGRHALMGKGLNFSNWLEAYWLMPSNSFPEVNRYNRTLVQNLVNSGIKNFRLPVTFERVAGQSAPYTIPANHTIWRLIDSTVLWAQQMNFSLIICNHHGVDITNANATSEIPRKTSIWQQVMARYGNLNPERYFFELYNEPTNAISNANLYPITNAMINTIRSTGSQHTLIVGGNNWNSSAGLASSQKYADHDIIYTFHDYDPFEFTHQGLSFTTPPYSAARAFPIAANNDSLNLANNINLVQAWADTSGVPLMMGEFGCSTAAAATSRCNWINTIANVMKTKSMAWYYWDAITLNDAFGYYNTANNTMISCFASALKLGASFNTCTKLVTNDLDRGVGSLREQLGCVAPGDTISFAPSLSGDTIKLYTSPVVLTKNVVLKNSLSNPIYITSLFNHPLLVIPPGVSSSLDKIRLLGKEQKIIENKGQIKIKNGSVKSPAGSQFKQDSGIIIIDGITDIK
jgi:endoglucanase